jgi:hypothetical protein
MSNRSVIREHLVQSFAAICHQDDRFLEEHRGFVELLAKPVFLEHFNGFGFDVKGSWQSPDLTISCTFTAAHTEFWSTSRECWMV